MTDVRVTNDLNHHAIGEAMGVLSRPRLWIPTAHDYPRHNEWLDKTEAQVLEGTKRVMLGYVDRNPVGAVVYRLNETESHTVDIRNISIDVDYRSQLLGSFLLRQAERDAVMNDYDNITAFSVDTKLGNLGMISFLERQGYEVYDITDLYQDGTGEDVILRKLVA
jgi:ribosomal protein S18 acetylase RimI-like enzyme